MIFVPSFAAAMHHFLPLFGTTYQVAVAKNTLCRDGPISQQVFPYFLARKKVCGTKWETRRGRDFGNGCGRSEIADMQIAFSPSVTSNANEGSEGGTINLKMGRANTCGDKSEGQRNREKERGFVFEPESDPSSRPRGSLLGNGVLRSPRSCPWRS